MEKNTQILAIAVIGIVIVATAGTATFYVMNKDDSDKPFQTDSVAQVYGNANNDFTVDSDDADFIKSIVDGKTTWNSTANPFADANADGSITEDDVDLVNKFIAGESCTVYYYDYWGDAAPLNLPISDLKIAVTYWQQGEEVGILGLWDKLVVANNSVFTSSSTSIYDTSGIKTIGTSGSSSSSVSSDAIQVMMENDVNLLIASCYTSIHDKQAELQNVGIQSIFLWHAGSYCLSTILTLGVLLDQEENAQKYVSYCDNITDTIAERLNGAEKKDAIILMMYENEAERESKNGGICTYVNQPEGAWVLMSNLVNPYTADPTNTSLGRSFYSVEWYMQNGDKFDYIIDIEESTGLDGTQEKYNERFEYNTSTFLGKTDAYSEGKIVGTTYSFGGFAGYSSLMTLAWMLYPDLFSHEEAMESMQAYYDEFTNASIDVNNRACYYTGDGYAALYLQ